MSTHGRWDAAASLAVRLTRRVALWKHRGLRLPVARNLRCLWLRRTSALYPGRAVGTQVVRHYWNRFLTERRMDIRGRALEIGVTGTIRHFGEDRVTSVEAIDVSPSDPSVTIVAERSTIADGLSTGVFLLGPDKGMALIEKLANVEGVIVTEKNNVLVSSGLARRLILNAPPTDAP